MVYNHLLVTDIITGAVMDDVVHDQWVEVRFGEGSLIIFDQDAICPRQFVGFRAGLKIGLIPLRISKVCNEGTVADDGSYVCKVIERSRVDGVWKYLFDLGVKVHLSWDEKLEMGSYYRVEGRLDLLDIEGEDRSGWRKVN
jgi:hypothetical protein